MSIDSEVSDQTSDMFTLIWVFAWAQLRFITQRLILNLFLKECPLTLKKGHVDPLKARRTVHYSAIYISTYTFVVCFLLLFFFFGGGGSLTTP